jgi:hypothetical protein
MAEARIEFDWTLRAMSGTFRRSLRADGATDRKGEDDDRGLRPSRVDPR